MLHPRNPQNQETQIPRYKFKVNQNPNLNLYHEIPRNLSFSIFVGFVGCSIFGRNFHMRVLLHACVMCILLHMNESCHTWTSNVTYEWVMSRRSESCHIWTSHVPYERVMSHMNELCHVWTSHVTNEWVMSHMNELCHIWMSHVTYERVMSRTNQVIFHMNESCHIWMSHVTYERVISRMNESCHIWTSHVTHVWVTPLDPRIKCMRRYAPSLATKETYERIKRNPWEYQKRPIKYQS